MSNSRTTAQGEQFNKFSLKIKRYSDASDVPLWRLQISDRLTFGDIWNEQDINEEEIDRMIAFLSRCKETISTDGKG